MTQEQTGFLNHDFRTALFQLVEYGTTSAPRGSETKEILNYNITLRSPRNRVITFPERKTSTKYLLGELCWYLGGDNTIEGILPYSKFWTNIVNSGEYDGYPKDTINSNYGNRLFGHAHIDAFADREGPFNQWTETISLLRRDKDTRQAIMNIHVPGDRHFGNKDVPCTLTLQWFIRENKLHLVVNMRSNDIIRGFTNDVFQFTMLQEIMLVNLREYYPELELGHYYHNAGSMHLYDLHYEMADKIIANPNAYDLEMIPMDRFDAEIQEALLGVERVWREHGFPEDAMDAEEPEDFDHDAFHAHYSKLTPYWQTLVKAMFFKDEEAMHAMFGQEHDE